MCPEHFSSVEHPEYFKREEVQRSIRYRSARPQLLTVLRKAMWAQPSCVIQQTQFHMDDMHWIGSPGWRDPLFVARKKAPQDSSETRGCCMGNTTRSDMKAFAQRKKIVVLPLNTRTYFPGAEKGSLQNPCREGIRYILWSLNLSAVLIPVSLSVVIAVASFFLHPALFAWWQC